MRASTHTWVLLLDKTKTKRNETRYKLQKRVRIKMEMQFHSKGWNDKIHWYLLSVGWAYMEKSYFILLSFHFPFYLYRVSIYRIVSGYVDDSVQFNLVWWFFFFFSFFSTLLLICQLKQIEEKYHWWWVLHTRAQRNGIVYIYSYVSSGLLS